MSQEYGNGMNNVTSVMVCGSDPASQAIRQICELFSLKLIIEACDEPIDLFIIVDGDRATETPIQKIRSGEQKLIYLVSNDTNIIKHNLYYLTFVLPTYRIPLERFSIVELARVIADIRGGASL